MHSNKSFMEVIDSKKIQKFGIFLTLNNFHARLD